MTFRARVLLALGGLAAVSLAIFALGVRREMNAELTRQYRQRVDALARVIRTDLGRQDQLVAGRLATLRDAIARDNRFRRSALAAGESDSRDYVLDYAAEAMRVSGLAFLQIQDEQGRIVSSGHFRNEFDLLDPALPRLLESAPDGTALVHARTAEGSFLAVARLDSVRLGARRYTLAGGVRADAAVLGRVEAEGMSVTLIQPGDTAGPADAEVLVVAEVMLPYIETEAGGDGTMDTARIVIRQSTAPLDAVIGGVDRWFAVALAAAGGVAVLLSLWLSSRISRPLAALAEQTANVDLDRLDVAFETTRHDEIGTLTRFLEAMTQRLRASVRTLREVERRAAVGDLARQVNHDIKNGLVPIRNVFKHLSEVARDHPAGLPEVFRERQKTVQAAVEYLERLAATYASLTPKLERARSDLNGIVGTAAAEAAEAAGAGVQVRLETADLPTILANDVALKRIVENLLTNALESLDGGPGTVTVATARSPKRADHVRVSVRDTGPGMTQEQLDQAFSGFYTTKPGGTGLGLAIVRRLVLDLGGALSVETAPGRGTTFDVDLPAA